MAESRRLRDSIATMDHYRTLQVTRDAEPEVIERAYKALSFKYHPDRASAAHREQATRRMQQINQAYAVLRNPQKRAAYDAALPAEHVSGWERFMEDGLVGLFLDRVRNSGR